MILSIIVIGLIAEVRVVVILSNILHTTNPKP